MRAIIQRTIFGIILLLSVLLAPFWVVLPFILAGFFLFPHFFEGIAAAITLDLLYGTGARDLLSPHTYLYTVVAIVLFWLSERLKRHLRFY